MIGVTRFWHLRQRQIGMSKRRQKVLLDFLLILRLHSFHFQFAATVTLRGYRDGDDFIHFLGNGLATVLAVGRAGLCPGGLGWLPSLSNVAAYSGQA